MANKRTVAATAASVKNAAKSRNDSRYRGNGRCWATPPELFAKLDAEFHFTLDPCATSKSAKCARFFTEDNDGLKQDWGIERVFMNPPYGSEIRPWIAKAKNSAARGALVVGLLPAETDSDWFHQHIVDVAEIRFIRGRIRFLVYENDGVIKWASPFRPNIIVIWRPVNVHKGS